MLLQTIHTDSAFVCYIKAKIENRSQCKLLTIKEDHKINKVIEVPRF